MEGRETTNFWYTNLWQWQIPLKIKMFAWLMLEHKILIWDNLVRRGFVGPNMFVLCGAEGENTKHLFVDCTFTKDIQYNILKQLKCKDIWEGIQVADYYIQWIKK